MCLGEDSDAFPMSFHLLGGIIDAESNAARSSHLGTRPGVVLLLSPVPPLSVPGLDYVSHEDILPYTSTDQVPIQHELFERFLLYDQTKGNLSQEDKLERDGSFFEDNIIEVISKLYFHNLIQPPIRPV